MCRFSRLPPTLAFSLKVLLPLESNDSFPIDFLGFDSLEVRSTPFLLMLYTSGVFVRSFWAMGGSSSYALSDS